MPVIIDCKRCLWRAQARNAEQGALALVKHHQEFHTAEPTGVEVANAAIDAVVRRKFAPSDALGKLAHPVTRPPNAEKPAD